MDSVQSILQFFYREGHLLHTSLLLYEKVITCFLALLWTDAKASVLKAGEELSEKVSASALAMSWWYLNSLSPTDKWWAVLLVSFPLILGILFHIDLINILKLVLET